MKKFLFAFAIFLLLADLSVQGQQTGARQVDTISQLKQLYRVGHFYISDQPDMEKLRWLRAQGVEKIINLRTMIENDEQATKAFPEKDSAEMLGFKYVAIPVNGKTGFNPTNQGRFNAVLDPGQPTLIHCASGGRATNMLMAWLITEQGYTLEEALAIGRSMMFRIPLEGLLDTEFEMQLPE